MIEVTSASADTLVVIVHGYGGGEAPGKEIAKSLEGEMCIPWCAPLSITGRRFRVVDNRGSTVDPRCEARDLARKIQAKLDDLKNIRRVVLVGFSIGGLLVRKALINDLGSGGQRGFTIGLCDGSGFPASGSVAVDEKGATPRIVQIRVPGAHSGALAEDYRNDIASFVVDATTPASRAREWNERSPIERALTSIVRVASSVMPVVPLPLAAGLALALVVVPVLVGAGVGGLLEADGSWWRGVAAGAASLLVAAMVHRVVTRL